VAGVVDFVHEKPQTVSELAEYVGVHPVTVRRWFKDGLEYAQRGKGKAYSSREALNRFLNPTGVATQATTAVVMDRETAAALKSLAARGIHFGATDGSAQRKAS
jgi:transposase-like protein